MWNCYKKLQTRDRLSRQYAGMDVLNRLANVQTYRQKSSHAFARVKRYLQHALPVERDEISV